MFICGDIQSSDFEAYLQVDDTLNFMMECDCEKMSLQDIDAKLTSMEKVLNDISLQLLIQRDLKNSCL